VRKDGEMGRRRERKGDSERKGRMGNSGGG